MTRVSLLRRAAVGTLAGVLACRYTTELAGASGSAKTATVTLNTGARMPALGFGTYLLTGDACRSAVLAALRAGYRHIDTAAGYLNEAQVAEALEESGLRREEVFIASKLWSDSHGTEATRRAIRTPHRAPTPDQLTGSPGRSATHTRVQCLPCLGNTLKRLRTPYLDLYLIHAPDNQGHTAAEIVELRRQSWVVMEEEHRKGTLRAIGVCNFEARHIDQLLRWGEVTPAVNQVYSRSAHTTHHLTVSPSHRLSVSPSHHLPISPSHRLTISPPHQVECHPYLQQRELSAYCASKVQLYSDTPLAHSPHCTHPSQGSDSLYSPTTLLGRGRRGLRYTWCRRAAR